MINIYLTNSRAPATIPAVHLWGTMANKITENHSLPSQFMIQFPKLPRIPWAFIFWTSLPVGILSRALSMIWTALPSLTQSVPQSDIKANVSDMTYSLQGGVWGSCYRSDWDGEVCSKEPFVDNLGPVLWLSGYLCYLSMTGVACWSVLRGMSVPDCLKEHGHVTESVWISKADVTCGVSMMGCLVREFVVGCCY